MKLLRIFTRRKTSATLTDIFVTTAAGAPMQSVQSTTAVAGVGLRGDRYSQEGGFWKAIEACQVTLISDDDLKRAKRRATPELVQALDEGRHRRNLVMQGLPTRALENRRFRIGDALFAYEKPRPPCGYLDQVEGSGLCKALGRNSGICVRVLQGGRFAVGDKVEIVKG